MLAVTEDRWYVCFPTDGAHIMRFSHRLPSTCVLQLEEIIPALLSRETANEQPRLQTRCSQIPEGGVSGFAAGGFGATGTWLEGHK